MKSGNKNPITAIVRIPLYDFSSLHDQSFRDAFQTRVQEIVENSQFIEGPYNTSFEKKFAKMQEARHCLLVANGTDALEISLLVSGIGPGDLVGIPAITFCATAEAVLNQGATPVFIDIQKETGLMDPQSLERVLKFYKLSAIIPVHLYGLPADIDAFDSLCAPKNVAIVEDAAQAHGAFVGKKPVGSGKNLATFSFYPTKNLSAFGDAGCILTQDDQLANMVRTVRNHGRGGEQQGILGRNSRCDHIQAAVLDLKLNRIEALNQRRKEIAKLYHQQLQGLPLSLVPDSYLSRSSWCLYPTFLKHSRQREELELFLTKKSIETSSFYLEALCERKGLSLYKGEWTNAIDLAGRALCLPIHPLLKDKEIHYVSDQLKEFFKRTR